MPNIKKEKIAAMKKVLSLAKSKEELIAFSVMYISDLSYPREDICRVLKEIEREKGWI